MSNDFFLINDIYFMTNNNEVDDVDYLRKRCLNVFIAHILLFVTTIIRGIFCRNEFIFDVDNVNLR